MRGDFFRALALPLWAMVLFLPSPARGQSATMIEVVPSTLSAQRGENVEVAVVVSGFGDTAAPSLGAYDLVLTFDPSIFAFDAVAVGPDFGAAATASTPGASGLEMAAVSLLTPSELNLLQPGAFTLFTATFEAVGTGNAAFDLTLDSALGDENGNPLADPVTVPADVAVAAVAVPAVSVWAVWLLVATLGLIGMRRAALARSTR